MQASLGTTQFGLEKLRSFHVPFSDLIILDLTVQDIIFSSHALSSFA